jgi:hypothetical protein
MTERLCVGGPMDGQTMEVVASFHVVPVAGPGCGPNAAYVLRENGTLRWTPSLRTRHDDDLVPAMVHGHRFLVKPDTDPCPLYVVEPDGTERFVGFSQGPVEAPPEPGSHADFAVRDEVAITEQYAWRTPRVRAVYGSVFLDPWLARCAEDTADELTEALLDVLDRPRYGPPFPDDDEVELDAWDEDEDLIRQMFGGGY